jgi:hypothetical protein
MTRRLLLARYGIGDSVFDCITPTVYSFGPLGEFHYENLLPPPYPKKEKKTLCYYLSFRHDSFHFSLSMYRRKHRHLTFICILKAVRIKQYIQQ